MSKTKTVFSILTVTCCLFLVREFFWGGSSSPIILVEKNIAIVCLQNQIFTFGDMSSNEAQMSVQAVTPYFFSKVFKLEDVAEGKKLSGNDVSVLRISPNILKMTLAGQTILFVADEISSAEKEKIAQTPVSLTADFWVLQKNVFPENLSLPRVAIISLALRASKKITEFAKEKKLPLVSATKTGGVMFEFDGEWGVQTRQ